MKRSTLLLALGAGAMAVLLASCTSGAEEPTTTTAAVSPTTPGVTVIASNAPNSSNCVDCHTDESSLEALAVEPVEENLNEGEG